MVTIDGPGCGVEDHAPECLCDVKIGEPTPILEDFNLMWGVERFRKGLDTLTVLEKLTKAHDMLHEANVPQPPRGTDEQRQLLFERIHLGVRVEVALAQLDLTIGDFVLLITKAVQASLWKWTLLDLIELQEFMADEGTTVRRVADTFGIDKTLVIRIFNLFGKKIEEGVDYRRKLTDAQREQVGLWTLENLPYNEVVRKCQETFGVQISRAYISMLAQKARARAAAV